MTPEETSVLLDCLDQAKFLVHKRIGFIDADVAQEVCETMIESVATYDPSKGATLKTWLLLKGSYRVIDAYREMRGRTGIQKAIRNPMSIDKLAPEFDTSAANDHRDSNLDWLLGTPEEGYDEVDTRLAAAQVEPDVVACLKQLSIRDQEMVLERIAGCNLLEIAESHGLTEGRASQICLRFRDRYQSHTTRRYAA